MTEEGVSSPDVPAWRPRWYFFAWFAVVAAVHLVGTGWTDTTAIGLPVGFAATLVLVFVRRLPRWMTGERSERPGRPPRAKPVQPRLRAVVSRSLRRRTVFVWFVLVTAVALVVTAFVAYGGWLPWLLSLPGLFAVLVAVEWRSKVAYAAGLLAAGPWTAVPAAVPEEDVWLGLPLEGWAVLPGGLRARLYIEDWSHDIGDELLRHRRLWVAGEPEEGAFAAGLPDGDTFAIGTFSVRSRDLRRVSKNTVPSPPAAG